MKKLAAAVAVVCFALAGVARAEAPAPIEVVQIVDEPLNAAWERWTTEAGLETFFAPAASITPEVDGRLDILFHPEEPRGERGAEGMRILAIEPGRRLAFTWNAPPNLPYARAQRSVVEVLFERVSDTQTRVTLRNFGFGEGNEEWAMARELLAGAWPVVMGRSAYAADVGPVDWANPPDGAMYLIPSAQELRATLASTSQRKN